MSGFMLIDSEFSIDETAVAEQNAERGPTDRIVVDQRTRGIVSGCRVTLCLLPIDVIADPDIQYSDIPLQLELHPSPGCQFTRCTLGIDLSSNPNARIRDMAPRGEVSAPVTYSIKRSSKASLQVPQVVGTKVATEVKQKWDVVYPTLTTSGINTAIALWTFIAARNERIHVRNELRLIAENTPQEVLLARITLNARARLEGLSSMLPLVAKVAHDQIYRLVSSSTSV
ncbi:MAG: hypothetical protein FWD61_02185 [Phycisphaerales bacterium]|nr:hypothetical protein [Phycisphaerales bacterium]